MNQKNFFTSPSTTIGIDTSARLNSRKVPFTIPFSWMRNIKLPTLFKKVLTFKINVLLVLFLLAIFFVAGNVIGRVNINNEVIKSAINQNYLLEDININVNEAQVTDNIKFSQKGTAAPEGKKFLVLFTDVENASSSGKQIVYGNWFRLDEEGKKLAPLPVNANFTIPPKATLEKQIVFLVDEGKSNFKLLVGDLEKEQKQIDINF